MITLNTIYRDKTSEEINKKYKTLKLIGKNLETCHRDYKTMKVNEFDYCIKIKYSCKRSHTQS